VRDRSLLMLYYSWMVWIKRDSGHVEDVPRYEVVSTRWRNEGYTYVTLRDGSGGRLLRDHEAATELEKAERERKEFWENLLPSDESEERDTRTGFQRLMEDWNKD
jgi:hypothetical protein